VALQPAPLGQRHTGAVDRGSAERTCGRGALVPTALTIDTTANPGTSEWLLSTTVLLKVASRCNLNCTYCYVYNMGDDGWRFAAQADERGRSGCGGKAVGRPCAPARATVQRRVTWGEPLLLGALDLSACWAGYAPRSPTSAGCTYRTNGVLLDDTILDICAHHGVGISVSLDGPEDVNDRFRVDLRGRGSQAHVMAAIERVRAHPKAGRNCSPGFCRLSIQKPIRRTSTHFSKATKAPSVDFPVPRRKSRICCPFRKGHSQLDGIRTGGWRDCWIATLPTPAPPRIRVLDDMPETYSGRHGPQGGCGAVRLRIVIIDTDGFDQQERHAEKHSVGSGRVFPRTGRSWNTASTTS